MNCNSRRYVFIFPFLKKKFHFSRASALKSFTADMENNMPHVRYGKVGLTDLNLYMCVGRSSVVSLMVFGGYYPRESFPASSSFIII